MMSWRFRLHDLWRTKAARLGRLALGCVLAGQAGCAWDHFHLITTPPPEGPVAGEFVLTGDGLEEAKNSSAIPAPLKARLAQGRELFRQEQYGKAEDIFDEVAEGSKNPPAAVQEAMFYRAECQRHTGHYPKAADNYVALLAKFPHTPYHDQAVQRMYDIANYWLEDTRAEMKEDKERREGKRWFIWPRLAHFEKTKPLLDEEGRAIEKLEQVRLYDIGGPLADHALFLCGVVKLYHEDYREADHYFSQIQAKHKDSQYAEKATELAIFCKHMSTGGPDYDGRKCAEARKLVEVALTSYPTLAREKGTFLNKQLDGINLQQAEKDFRTAEFYARTGHPGSAYWYFDLVIRRYPNTKVAEQAKLRKAELETQRERDGKAAPPEKATPAPAPAAPKSSDQPGLLPNLPQTPMGRSPSDGAPPLPPR